MGQKPLWLQDTIRFFSAGARLWARNPCGCKTPYASFLLVLDCGPETLVAASHQGPSLTFDWFDFLLGAFRKTSVVGYELSCSMSDPLLTPRKLHRNLQKSLSALTEVHSLLSTNGAFDWNPVNLSDIFFLDELMWQRSNLSGYLLGWFLASQKRFRVYCWKGDLISILRRQNASENHKFNCVSPTTWVS